MKSRPSSSRFASGRADDLAASFALLFNSSHSTWLTQMFILMTFFWGLALAAIGNMMATYVPDRKWTGSGNCFFGVLMMISSVMASFSHCISQKTRLLLFYMSVMLVANIGITLCSGASYFYRGQLAAFVNDNWEEEVNTAWSVIRTLRNVIITETLNCVIADIPVVACYFVG